MSDRNDEGRDDPDPWLVIAAIAGTAWICAVAWSIAAATTLVGSGRRPEASVVEAVIGCLRVVADARWTDPGSAFGTTGQHMPAWDGWWATTTIVGTAATVATAALIRWAEPLIAQPVLDRRPGQLRGLRPRAWARPRDIAKSSPEGFSVGRLDHRAGIRTDAEAHVALVAPTRAGKTTSYVIPWLLEHDGPAVVTSTKRDVLEATRERRARGGRIWVVDPFADDTAAWSPLHGCEEWSYALRQAQWLADATQQGASEIAGYWRGEAAKLLAPMLHAAALSGRGMADVLRWIDGQDAQSASRTLLANDAQAAELQLQAVIGLDPRNRGTTFMSTGSVLAAYRYPEVLDTARDGELTAVHLLDGEAHTLYIVAPERHQRLLEPLLVSLLSSILHAAMERPRSLPVLRVLLDEAANIAPLRDLPRTLSQAAGHGIRIATVWQSLAQLEERYGRSADTVLANSRAKLFMGSISDDHTRRYVEEALASRKEHDRYALRRLERARALYLAPGHPPAVVRTPVSPARGL